MLNSINPRVKVVTLNRKPGSRSLLPLIRLNYEFFKFRSQIVHCHSYTIPAYILPFPGRELFETIHALNVPEEHSGRVSCLFAISDAVNADMSKRTNTKIITIPNGINTEKISIKTNFDYTNSRSFKIVNVARLEHEKKGQHILIEAIAKLKKEGYNIDVDFIGNGNSQLYLQQFIDDNNLSANVHLLGLKDRNYIYANLCNYDLMCHPSIYEGFGLTVAEGMAANLPILVSDEGGPHELIEYGKLGESFKNKNSDDCANKIKHIIENYSNYVPIAQQARNKVIQEYSLISTVNKYIVEYNKNLNQK
jgi:glycosyltransferase involved in cell wall biosynthesis